MSGFRCQVSGVRVKVSGLRGKRGANRNFMDVEDLEVYKNSYVEWVKENIGA
jgi:hypothetical protein